MKMNRNSLLARLYRDFYDIDEYWQYMPQNLCLFIPKLIFAMLLYLPVFVVGIPALIFKTKGVWKRFLYCIFSYIGLFFLYFMLIPVASLFMEIEQDLFNTGIAIDIMFAFIMAVYLIVSFVIKYIVRPLEKKKFKGCKIDWYDKD